MAPNPFNDLLHSRRFWLAISAAIVNLVTLYVNMYASPETKQFVLSAMAIIDTPVVILIIAITTQNNTQIKATGDYKPTVEPSSERRAGA